MVPPSRVCNGGRLTKRFSHMPSKAFYDPAAFEATVRVTVRLMGPYKRLAGVTDDVSVTPAEPTLGGVLAAIAERYPEAGRKLQPSAGKIEPAVRIVVNDVVLQGATVAHGLKDGDRVAFVPIVGGGLT